VSCSFGSLLVAATTKGLCAVALGDDTTKLESFLRSEFPGAEIICDQLLPNRWVDVLLEYLNGSTRRLDIPLDLHGTEFQRRVWEEIRAIPYGTTRTYSEVASAAGQPAAVRATASACAANPVSLAVPCHRVVRKDGTLGGYGWGLERKSKLLQMERDNTADN
jgi:AraC family transcriptional regulator, regulatory protein of adaptative response / methylated-DNA-[protein]-cysteine methyltransferase